MVGLEVAEEVHAKAAGLLRHVTPLTFRARKVALPLHGRAFEGTGPGGQLPGAGFRQSADFLQVPEVRLEPGPVLDHRHHGAHLAARAPRNSQKGQQLIRGHALESLGNVVGNGQRSAVELVAEARRERDAGFFQEIEHAVVEPRRLLPDGQFFELGVFGHVVFSFQTWFGVVGYWLLTIGDSLRLVSLTSSAYTPVLAPESQKAAATILGGSASSDYWCALDVGEKKNGPAARGRSRPVGGNQRYR